MNRFINDTKKYWKYTLYAAKSQLKTEVANSYLNWIWWVLEPFCFMLIYAFIFGYMLGHKELYYNVYIFVGLAIWGFLQQMYQEFCQNGEAQQVHCVESVFAEAHIDYV